MAAAILGTNSSSARPAISAGSIFKVLNFLHGALLIFSERRGVRLDLSRKVRQPYYCGNEQVFGFRNSLCKCCEMGKYYMSASLI